MSEPQVGVGEFRRALGDLKDMIRDGFDRITDRQDIANGRTNKLEAQQAAQAERLTGIDREIRDLKLRPLVAMPSDDGTLKVTVGKSMAGWLKSGLFAAGAGAAWLLNWIVQHWK